MAGAGLDAHVVAQVKGNVKRMFGKGAYWVAGFQSLSRRLEEMDAEFNDVRVRCSFALLSRVRNYGGDLEIVLNAGLLHNQLGAYLFEGSNSFRYLKYFTGVLLRTAAGMSGITATRLDRLSLSAATAPVRLQVDGEDAGFLPVTVEIVPDALTILLPPAYLAKERKRWTT
jgi:diacylglycerol kinase family enzyme